MSVALEEKKYSHVLQKFLQLELGSIDTSLLVGLLVRIYNQTPNSKIFPQGKRKDKKTNGDAFHTYNPLERSPMDRVFYVYIYVDTSFLFYDVSGLTELEKLTLFLAGLIYVG